MAVSNFKVKTVSDRELLFWYRGNISPNLMRLQELGNAIDFCIGVDMMFPGVIGIRVLEATEKTEYFKRLNFRRLRDALSKLNVKTEIPVDGLIKGSFKDTFAFGIWFRAFFEANSKSHPDDLYKVRAFHLNRLIKTKKPYKYRKTDLHAKSVNSSNSDGDVRADANDTGSVISVISSTELNEVESDLQTPEVTPSDPISVEENKRIVWSQNMPFVKTKDISTDSSSKENKHFDSLKVSDIAEIDISNMVKEIADDLGTDCKTDADETTTDSLGNSTDISTNLLSECTSALNLTPLSCLSDPSFEKMVESAIFSEQTNIEQNNGNGDVTEEMLNEVKNALAKMKQLPATEEPTVDQVCVIKNVANALERLTTISNIESQ